MGGVFSVTSFWRRGLRSIVAKCGQIAAENAWHRLGPMHVLIGYMHVALVAQTLDVILNRTD